MTTGIEPQERWLTSRPPQQAGRLVSEGRRGVHGFMIFVDIKESEVLIDIYFFILKHVC